MSKLFLSFICGAALMLASARSFPAAQEGIAAVVNDSVITVTDIRDRTTLYLAGGPQNASPAERKKMEQQVLSRLIDESLQMQEARKMGIAVGDEDVKAGFADISRQNGVSPEEFKNRLTQLGAPVGSLYDQIKANIAWALVVRRKLRPQVNISESEIDLTLSQITHGDGKPRYQVAEIFLNIPAPEKEAATRDEAGKLVKQLTAGASFANVAREFSQAPGAAAGGDLGWVQEGQLDPELDKALKKMRPGQISPPIRSAKGYHILFLRDIGRNEGPAGSAAAKPAADGPSAGKNDDAAREKIAINLGMKRLDQMALRYLRDLRATAFIDKRI